MLDNTYTPPTHMKVQIPQVKRAYEYGVYSTKHKDAKRITVRIDPQEAQLLEEVCKILEIPPSTFMRDIAMKGAKAVKEHYDAYRKSRRTG